MVKPINSNNSDFIKVTNLNIESYEHAKSFYKFSTSVYSKVQEAVKKVVTLSFDFKGSALALYRYCKNLTPSPYVPSELNNFVCL